MRHFEKIVDAAARHRVRRTGVKNYARMGETFSCNHSDPVRVITSAGRDLAAGKEDAA